MKIKKKDSKVIGKVKDFFKKNIKMKVLVLYIIINLLYIFIASFLVTTKAFTYIKMAKGYVPLLVINVIVAIIICIKKYYKKNITHLFLALIIIFGIISTIFAIKPEVALWGIGGRYEGLFTILYYFSLMFLSSFVSKKYRKVIIWTILVGGAIQCIYAICQISDVEGVYRMIHSTGKIKFKADGFELEKEVWATGFATNPNFFGTYMLLCATFALGLYIDEKKIIKSIMYLLFFGLFIVGLLISNTASTVVGLGAASVIALIYCIKNKYIKKILFFAVIVVGTTLAIYKFGKTTLIKDMTKVGQQSTEMAKGNIQENYGTNRIYIWKNTLKIVPKYIVHGVGIDNFYYAFDGKALVTKNGRTFFDKVHNEYLQILITEGIFCLIAYLAFYLVIVLRGMKNSFRNNEIYILIPVIGYLVQAFFNISVIEVAPIFFVALGFCDSKYNERLFQKKVNWLLTFFFILR